MSDGMSEMVERVAKALYEWQEGKTDYETADPESKEDAREAARAAIEAMREPSGAMLATVENNGAYLDWQAMIDEALK